MTDDEAADKWVKHNRCECCVNKEECDLGYINCFAKQAYLEGLKAGSQLDRVWHDYAAGEDCYEDSHEGRWIKRSNNARR